VPEWLNGAVSKTVKGGFVLRGFESLPLRRSKQDETTLEQLGGREVLALGLLQQTGAAR
jgi:hypothetical protein